MNTFDLDRLMITEDSFGSDLPRNWEAIASRLNTEIFDRIVTAGIEDPQEAYEIASSIWEDYCSSDDKEEETAMKHTIYDFADLVDISVVEHLRDCSTPELFNRIDASGSWDSEHAAEALVVIAERLGELDKLYDAEEWTDYWTHISEGPFILFRDQYGRGTVTDQYPGILTWEEFNQAKGCQYFAGPEYYDQRIADGQIAFVDGWTVEITDITPDVGAMLSLDNGNSYISVDDLPDYCEEILQKWDAITSFMDNKVREAVHITGIYDKIEFLARYLRRSRYDLIIG